MPEGFLLWTSRSHSVFWGVIVPSLIFLLSFLIAYGLYRKFSPK